MSEARSHPDLYANETYKNRLLADNGWLRGRKLFENTILPDINNEIIRRFIFDMPYTDAPRSVSQVFDNSDPRLKSIKAMVHRLVSGLMDRHLLASCQEYPSPSVRPYGFVLTDAGRDEAIEMPCPSWSDLITCCMVVGYLHRDRAFLMLDDADGDLSDVWSPKFGLGLDRSKQ